MRHSCLPELMTVEQLADYIITNKVEVKNHIEKHPLSEEEINQYQKDATLATMQINKLKGILKYFSDTVKNGTPWSRVLNDNEPLSVTIPPSKGLKVLEANRNFATKKVEDGFREEVTSIYMIPWPEYEKMVAVDIVGEEWTKYSRKMTSDEVKQHGKPILHASQTLKDALDKSGIEIERVDGKEVTLVQKEGKKGRKKSEIDKQPPLSEDEQRELDSPERDAHQGPEGDDLNL